MWSLNLASGGLSAAASQLSNVERQIFFGTFLKLKAFLRSFLRGCAFAFEASRLSS